MTRCWEAEYRGGGRFWPRPRRRLGRPAGAGCVLVVCAGCASRPWDHVDASLHSTSHVTVGHLAGVVLVGGALVWLWLRSGRT